MTTADLSGRTVVVTRSRSQAPDMVDRLVRRGASVVELPVIAVVDPDDGGKALELAAHRLNAGAYQWVVVTSVNAADRLLAALGDGVVPSSVRWAAVGAGTVRALARGGMVADLVPPVSVSEALAEGFPSVVPLPSPPSGSAASPGATARPVTGGTVLFPRAETVRGVLADGIRAKGWLVDEVVAYRTVAGDPDAAAVGRAREADAVAFTSSSTVERTIELLGADGLPPVVVTIGPVTSRSVRDAGREVTAEASPHTIEGLVDAVAAALGAGHRSTGGATGRGQHQQ